MADSVRVILADKYDLVVGDTFQLFYRGVIEAPNPYCYSIVAECEKGKNYPRYFEYTPETPGKHKLTIRLFDAMHNMVGCAETLLNVVQPVKTDKHINILCIGASGTANGWWVSELHRRLTKTDGEPAGLGCPNIKFVGNCRRTEPGRNEVGFEAFGGWSWNRFTSAIDGGMWVKTRNNRTHKDQHSIWQDENGGLWQLETLQIDYLKFNRYKDHNSPMPTGGFLTHYSDADDTSPIPITSTFAETSSPFLDPDTKQLDFKGYAQRSNIETIDAVYVLLGLNGLLRTDAVNNTRHDYCKIVVSEAKVLIDALKRDFPDVKVKVIAPYLPSQHGGCSYSSGAHSPFTNGLDITHYIMELNLAYQAWANEDGYKDFMEFISSTGQFDAEYNYPCIQKPVNTRCEVTEQLDTNGLHPTRFGYWQVADAVYRNVVKEFCSEEN